MFNLRRICEEGDVNSSNNHKETNEPIFLQVDNSRFAMNEMLIMLCKIFVLDLFLAIRNYVLLQTDWDLGLKKKS